jgi:hypothetical protein
VWIESTKSLFINHLQAKQNVLSDAIERSDLSNTTAQANFSSLYSISQQHHNKITT